MELYLILIGVAAGFLISIVSLWLGAWLVWRLDHGQSPAPPMPGFLLPRVRAVGGEAEDEAAKEPRRSKL